MRERARNSTSNGLLGALLLVSLVAGLWGLTFERVRYEKEHAVAEAVMEHSNLAIALEEQTIRTLKGVDQKLLFLKYEFERAGMTPRIQELIRDLGTEGLFNDFTIYDENASYVVGFSGKGADVSDREFFTAQRAGPLKEMYIAKPVIGRVSGRWAIHMSRRIEKADGTFGGAILAAVSPDYFTKLYQQVDLGSDGLVSLTGLDGVSRARRAGAVQTSGEILTERALIARQAVSPSGSFLSEGKVDGIPRYFSYRTLPDYPLIVAVAESQAHVLAPVHQRERNYYAIAWAATLVALGVSIVFAALLRRQRRSVHLLAESENRYRGIFEGAVEGIFQSTPEGKFITANPAMARLLGYASPELLVAERIDIGKQGYVDPRRREEFMRLVEQHGSVRGFEYEMLRKDGERIRVSETARVVRDEAGATLHYEGFLEDISERTRAESRARESQARTAEILETALDAIITSDCDGQIVEFNRAAERTFGHSRAAAIGYNMASLLAPLGRRADLARHFECEGAVFPQERFETLGRHENGTIFPMEISITRNVKVDPLQFTSFIRDLTERRLAEQAHASLEAQLRESQKMEAIGSLAGGVAHDFNNILGAILGNVALASEDLEQQPRAMECLDEIRKAGHRARALVQQILAFSRKQPTERQPTAIAPIVEESARLLGAALPARIHIDFACAADTPAILADATQIQQVLINLGDNSAHAIGGRPGHITIRADRVVVDAANAVAGLEPGPHARIAVVDDGGGMDPETVRRIFEPFFTTKAVGEGTGLGLSVVHGIVRSHQGVVAVRSAPGEGTTFELYFPAGPAIAVGQGPVHRGPAAIGSGQRILYIDDDEALGFLMMRMLRRRKFQVQSFSDQREGLEALRADPHGFDLVVTDYNMPGMSGIDVALQCRAIAPDVPVALASGYITDDMRRDAAEAGIRELIFKPDVVEEFLDVVERLLAAREAERPPAQNPAILAA